MTARRVLPFAAALTVAVAGLAGCGGGDSTVSGVPASETMAPPPSPATGDEGAPAPAGDGVSGRYTETPGPVPSSAPGFSAPRVGAREKGYLDALKTQGVKTDPLADALVAAGNTVCRIRSTGGAAGETTTIADAVAGQIVAGGYSDKPVQEVSRIVVDASTSQLCP